MNDVLPAMRNFHSAPAVIEYMEQASQKGLHSFENVWISGKLKAGERVLVAACSVGREMREIRKKGCRVIGIDHSEKCVRRAQKLDAGTLVVGNLTNLPFKNDVFQAIVSFDTLNCVLSARERLRVVSEWKRVIKSGQLVIFYDGLLRRPFRRLRHWFSMWPQRIRFLLRGSFPLRDHPRGEGYFGHAVPLAKQKTAWNRLTRTALILMEIKWLIRQWTFLIAGLRNAMRRQAVRFGDANSYSTQAKSYPVHFFVPDELVSLFQRARFSIESSGHVPFEVEHPMHESWFAIFARKNNES